MTKKQTNQIAHIRKRKGLTQQQLADKLGVHWVTISKLERGVMQLTTEWIRQIAEALEVRLSDLLEDNPYRPTLSIGGVIESGQVSPSYIAAEYFVDTSMIKGLGDTTWIHVADNSMAPYFVKGDLLRFDYFLEENYEKVTNRLCLFTNGEDDERLGVLLKYHEDRSIDVRLLNGLTLRHYNQFNLIFLVGYQPAFTLVEKI